MQMCRLAGFVWSVEALLKSGIISLCSYFQSATHICMIAYLTTHQSLHDLTNLFSHNFISVLALANPLGMSRLFNSSGCFCLA